MNTYTFVILFTRHTLIETVFHKILNKLVSKANFDYEILVSQKLEVLISCCWNELMFEKK